MLQETHLLVVDDDPEIRSLLQRFLCRHGFAVSVAANGVELFERLAQSMPELIVLDLMLPGEDGLSLCRRLRARWNVPIIMLTAMDEDTERIIGLELGADDYLGKPFNPRELLARIKAVLRRSAEVVPGAGAAGHTARFAGWSLDLARRELRSARGMLVPLSAGEFDLLITFVDHPLRVLSRDQLLDYGRGRAAAPFDRSVDVQVSRLRRIIEDDPRNPALIKTIRGGGYLFATAVERS